MIQNTDSWGAKAIVQLRFDGSLQGIAELLQEVLQLKEFSFDTDQDPPHEEFASGEALGFEYWLYKSSTLEGYNFEFRVETMRRIEDLVHGKMSDISLWLAKHISIFNIECGVHNSEEQTHIEFLNGEVKRR